MYSFRNDPDVDGVGIAFVDAVGPDGGRLDLGTSRDRPRSPHWEVVEADLGVRALAPHQVHGDRVVVVDDSTDAEVVAGTAADALVTGSRGLALAVRVADCLPVLLADPRAGVIAAAHAGRVGLAAGVLPRVVEALSGLGAVHVTAWIGPHICGGCYEVPSEMRDEVAAALPSAAARTTWGTASLDLGAAAEAQLVGLGCAVRRLDPCTFTTPSLHSYRRDGAAAGRQAGLVWLP